MVEIDPKWSSKTKAWVTRINREQTNREVWGKAMGNMPRPLKNYKAPDSAAVALCLGISKSQAKRAFVGGVSLKDPLRREMLQKLAHPEYGRAFAAIRLTALGVADQYDWGDK